MEHQCIARAKVQWEAAVDSLPQLVCLVDGHGRVVRANRTLEAWNLGGVTCADGMRLHQLLHPECRATDCYLTGLLYRVLGTAVAPAVQEQVFDPQLERALRIAAKPLLAHRAGDAVSRPLVMLVFEDLSASMETRCRTEQADTGWLRFEGATERHSGQIGPVVELLDEKGGAHARGQGALDAPENRYTMLLKSTLSGERCGTDLLSLGVIRTGNNLDQELGRAHVHERLKAPEQQLRGLSAQLIAAQENERKRIAIELHDGLGQSLSAIKFTVEDVLREVAVAGRSTEAKRLAGIVERLRDTIENVRHVSMDLRPSILDDLGLIATLQWFCREFCQVYRSVRITRNVTVAEGDIPDRLKVVIFRIAQEALHNIVKHAAADQVVIRLIRHDDGLRLSVRDNGKGFDYMQAFAAGTGLGLKSMHHRAHASGGSFAVKSRRRWGTEISALWPAQ